MINYSIILQLGNSPTEKIVIIGHSFMGVDEQYYRDILVPLYKDKKWIFYYYQSDELARIFIDKYGVKDFDLIEI